MPILKINGYMIRESGSIAFANNLYPDQAPHNVGPDLDPNCLTLIEFLKVSFEKVGFEKSQQTTKCGKVPSRLRVN